MIGTEETHLWRCEVIRSHPSLLLYVCHTEYCLLTSLIPLLRQQPRVFVDFVVQLSVLMR